MWRRYLRLLGDDPAADVEDELAFHLSMRVEDLMRRGIPEEEARLQAEREFGDVDHIRSELSEMGQLQTARKARARRWDSLRQDVGFALRTLRRSPGFPGVAVLTLAVGIGAGTAMFSVMNGVLLRELAVRDDGDVVVMWTQAPTGVLDHLPIFTGELNAFRETTQTFEAVGGVAFQGAGESILRDGERSLYAIGTWVTGDLFPLLDLTPALGRTLRPSDDLPGAEPVMIIGYGFWERHFGRDPAVIGRVIEYSGRSFTVIGVLPRGFEFPRRAEFWVPVFSVFPEEAASSSSSYVIFDLVGRLRPGMTARDAHQEYATFLRNTDAERPVAWRGMEPVIISLRELITGDTRAALWTAAGVVSFLLLIGSLNVANLLLIRGSARTQELAVRTALGADRRRLVRQLLTESGVLAFLAGVLGVPLAFWGVRVLVALAPPELPRLDMIAVDTRSLCVAVGVTAIVALLSGLLPAVVSATGAPGARLRGSRRTVSSGRGAQALRHALVVGQISLAMLAVVAAGLLVRSLVSLQRVEMGFNQEQLLVLRTSLPSESVPERDRQVALRDEMIEGLKAIPGVISVASLSAPPFSGQGGWSASVTGEDQTPEAQATNPWVTFDVVGPEFFRTLEIPLVRGREFEAQDREDAVPVVIVSEAVARRIWPGEDPVGKRLKRGPPESPGEWATVVGVVGETRYRELRDPEPSLYLPDAQFGGPVPMTVAVRTSIDPENLVPQIHLVLREVHPDWMLIGGGTMNELLAAPLAHPRFNTFLLGTFAAITLLLAAVGTYGAMAATVRQRSHEIGIRLALGATAEEVQALVLRQGMQLALLGCAIGIGGALLGTRLLRSLLFGVDPSDPTTFLSVAGIVLLTAALACYVPAWNASRVDPIRVLRAE